MRTTVDIPDELLRRDQARAALQGVRLRGLIKRGLRLALATPPPLKTLGRVEFPLRHSQQPGACGRSGTPR